MHTVKRSKTRYKLPDSQSFQRESNLNHFKVPLYLTDTNDIVQFNYSFILVFGLCLFSMCTSSTNSLLLELRNVCIDLTNVLSIITGNYISLWHVLNLPLT